MLYILLLNIRHILRILRGEESIIFIQTFTTSVVLSSSLCSNIPSNILPFLLETFLIILLFLHLRMPLMPLILKDIFNECGI